MEPVETMSEGEWSSLSGMYNTTEEADFMAQLLANPPMPSVLETFSSLGVLSHLWPGHDSIMDMAGINKSVHYSSELASTNLFHYLRKNSFSGSNSSFFPTPTSSGGNYVNESHPVNNDSSMLMDFDNGEGKPAPSYLTPGDECMSGCNVEQESRGIQLDNVFPDKGCPDIGKKHDMQVIPSPGENTNVLENKRRTRTAEVQTNKRNVRTSRNKNQSPSAKTKEDRNEGANWQSASTNCSEDESDGLQNGCAGLSPSVSSKENPAAPYPKGKSRASRGTATDPQSLYARNRRERINERLRILQSLVPNGTKVDISTMLEEAVRYVKFLQLQIKLLSSDDLWMYSPIAYNGMNIGLDLNIPLPPKRS